MTYRERKWLGNIDSKKETRKEIGLKNKQFIKGKMIKIERNRENDIKNMTYMLDWLNSAVSTSGRQSTVEWRCMYSVMHCSIIQLYADG